MKILLINPITTEKKMYTSTPNLGLAYIATALIKNGHEVDLFDGMKKGMNTATLRERLNRADYDVAGVQVYTCSVGEARECIETIKAVNPCAVTIAGGAHPSCDPENVLDTLGAEFAFRGEAEEGLPVLLRRLQLNAPKDYSDIPNLIWRSDDSIRCNPLQPIQDIDALGIPHWDLIHPDDYPMAPIGGFAKQFPLATISCSRGCTHHCTYCANSMIMGRKLRTRSSESILQEMTLLYTQYGVREFQIIDDCFTSNKPLASSVCRGIIANNLTVSISFPNGVRVESLDEELVQLLEQAGCYSLGLGIESGSQRIVNHMKRGQSLKMIEEKVRMINRVSNIRMSGFFIIGYPEENEADILLTIAMAKRLPLSRAQFTVWMPVPGSEMTRMLTETGGLKQDFSTVRLQRVSYTPDQISLDDFKRLLRKAYIDFYCRPAIILGLLREIQSIEHLKNITKRVVQSFFIK